MPQPYFRQATSAIAAFWRGRVARHGRGGWWVLLGLVAVVLAAVAYLIAAESPWDRGIPEKLSGERELSIRDTIVAGLWLGAAINAVLGVGLLALAGWWAKPLPERPAWSAKATGTALPPRIFWLFVLLAVVAAAWLRAPRLHHSFWNDEEQAFRKFTWGEYEPEHAGSDALVFDEAGWDRALFYSVNGNNHVVHTVAAKLFHSVWRAVVRPEPEVFREWVIRLEPYISGLLTIVVLALWLRRSGFPLAGVAAACLLAVHPWVLRYAVEARGYSAMLLCMVLAFLAATEAVATGRWRWWLAYGLCQCLYLLCFAGAVYLAVAMNGALAVMLLVRRDRAGLGRWLVVNVLGAMGFLQIMTATVLRIWSWIQAPHVDPFPMDLSYLRDFIGHLTLGVPWSGPEPGAHAGMDVAQLSAASPLWAWAFRLGLPLLTLAGGVTAWRRAPQLRLALGALAAAAVLIYVHNTVSDLAFYGWYALYLTLGWVVALAFVVDIGVLRSVRFGPALAAVLVVSGMTWVGWKPLATLRTNDRHPMRQAVIAARGEAPAIDVRHAGLITAAVGSGANQLRTYDPRVLWVKTPADLEKAIGQARAASKPLFIYVCGPGRLRHDHPDLAARLEDAGQFEPAGALPGQEAFWSFQLYRWKGAE